MSKMIVGIFNDPVDAANAIDELVLKNINEERISVLASEPTAKQSLGMRAETKGAEGTAVGGSIGAATGAILAGLTSVGALATGGAGLLVAGPLVAIFTGAGVGAVSGGVLGGLIGLGFTELTVQQYQKALEKGSALLAVDTEKHEDDKAIENILKNNKAESIDKL